MVRVTISNSVKREQDFVDPSTTIRQVLDGHGVDYSRSAVHLDGVPLQLGDMDKTFEGLGITESCYLSTAVKTTNA